MENWIFEWVIRYCSGSLSQKEGKELRDWVDCTPENRKQFEQYLRIVKLHRMVVGPQRLELSNSWKDLQKKLQKHNQRRLVRKIISIAAVLVLSVGVGMIVLLHQKKTPDRVEMLQILPGTTKATLVLSNGSQVNLMDENLKEIEENGVWIENDTMSGLQYHQTKITEEKPIYHTIKVPIGGEYNFTLSDGTKVWMNSDSELKFPIRFTGDKREIYLKGEIYVEVSHDSIRPFVVHAAEVAIEVLGTKFNVSAYTGDMQVVTTLLQGAVQVFYADGQQLLQPGEQVIADLKDLTLKTEQVDAFGFISWIKGVFEYENMPLEKIVAQLERWYDVDFIFSAPEFKERHFTGVVKKYDVLNDVLKMIEKTTNVCFVVDGRIIAVQEAYR